MLLSSSWSKVSIALTCTLSLFSCLQRSARVRMAGSAWTVTGLVTALQATRDSTVSLVGISHIILADVTQELWQGKNNFCHC